MGEESPNPASTPRGAVFLSYASQDAEAAQRICAALRSAGVEVWFDQSELRSGDAWDRQIRERVHDCRLFVPVISANTEARSEGYFRREWKLAIERTHDMSERIAFIVPVVIDQTRDARADVPEAFRSVQWTRLPAGETPPEFVRRIQQLLSGEASFLATVARGAAPVALGRSSRLKPAWVAVALAAVAACFIIEKPWVAKPVAFAPPPHSIAVLPFVNMSGDKEQEYFSEGLTEEILNSLARINELQVSARTSSFSFQGEHPDVATVAHRLNVAAVLEGSVRRSANTVRITTQLVNGTTGFHLWSETYDRDLGGVLKLQTEIATAVAAALKVTLLGGEAAKIEIGGTHNPAAFDAYLRASKIYFSSQSGKDNEAAIAGYTEAIRLDPNYALAYATRAIASTWFAESWATTTSAVRTALDNAQADARRSIALAPGLGEAHLALARVYEDRLEFAPASGEYEHALTLTPGNSRIVSNYGNFALFMGHKDSGFTALRRAVALDPLNVHSQGILGQACLIGRRYAEAISVLKDAQALNPVTAPIAIPLLGQAYYLFGDLQSARAYCERSADADDGQLCLAMTYKKLGRQADAEAMLAKLRASDGDAGAVEYAAVYAQWGNSTQALDWLEAAMRDRLPDLRLVKSSPFLDPLRKEPRFQAIERELKFPD
jgi:TolB-like protein/Flp pilus assembly protein TadD